MFDSAAALGRSAERSGGRRGIKFRFETGLPNCQTWSIHFLDLKAEWIAPSACWPRGANSPAVLPSTDFGQRGRVPRIDECRGAGCRKIASVWVLNDVLAGSGCRRRELPPFRQAVAGDGVCLAAEWVVDAIESAASSGEKQTLRLASGAARIGRAYVFVKAVE